METKFFSKQTTRREILRTGAALAGSGVLAGLMPGKLLSAVGPSVKGLQQVASSADRLAQMRAQMSAIPLVTAKLRDNIYLLSGPGGNMVLLSGADGKILVDSSFAGVAPKIKTALEGIGGTPLKILVNTHWHFDHTDGNEAMHAAGAVIIAHENTRKRLSTPQDIAASKVAFENFRAQ